MANLYSSLNNRAELSGGNPLDGWVYTSHYKWFRATPNADAGSLAEFNTMGHSFQRAVAPNWSAVQTHTGNQINMFVDSNRWDAASLKQVMDEQVYRSTNGDTTWTVAEADGAWRYGDNSDLWSNNNFRKKTNAYTHFTEANFPATTTDGYLADNTTNYSTIAQITHDETVMSAADNEYNAAIRKGMNFNFGNFFDGTGRGINYPGDLAITTDNLYLLVLEGDDFDENDINQTSDAIYDINGGFEKMISEFNPLAYTWLKSSETSVGSAEELIMMLDAKTVDPFAVRDRFNALGLPTQTGVNDVYIWVTAPDLQWTGA